jgi:hypothetical protein
MGGYLLKHKYLLDSPEKVPIPMEVDVAVAARQPPSNVLGYWGQTPLHSSEDFSYTASDTRQAESESSSGRGMKVG